jgi:hypothetical protein
VQKDGTLRSTKGFIGTWVISSTGLANNSVLSSSTVGVAPGTSASTGDHSFWAGGAPTTAPFRVSNTGVLFASNANITGTINAGSGSIGGWTISSNRMTSGNLDLFAGDGYMGVWQNANRTGAHVVMHSNASLPMFYVYDGTNRTFEVSRAGSVSLLNAAVNISGTVNGNPVQMKIGPGNTYSAALEWTTSNGINYYTKPVIYGVGSSVVLAGGSTTVNYGYLEVHNTGVQVRGGFQSQYPGHPYQGQFRWRQDIASRHWDSAPLLIENASAIGNEYSSSTSAIILGAHIPGVRASSLHFQNDRVWAFRRNKYDTPTTNQGFDIVAAESFFSTSDPTLKDDVVPIAAGVLDAVVKKVKPVEFTFKGRDKVRRGFNAADLDELGLAHRVDTALCLDPLELVAVLWEAVRELKAQVDALIKASTAGKTSK